MESLRNKRERKRLPKPYTLNLNRLSFFVKGNEEQPEGSREHETKSQVLEKISERRRRIEPIDRD